jgi:hypothetical protein
MIDCGTVGFSQFLTGHVPCGINQFSLINFQFSIVEGDFWFLFASVLRLWRCGLSEPEIDVYRYRSRIGAAGRACLCKNPLTNSCFTEQLVARFDDYRRAYPRSIPCSIGRDSQPLTGAGARLSTGPSRDSSVKVFSAFSGGPILLRSEVELVEKMTKARRARLQARS